MSWKHGYHDGCCGSCGCNPCKCGKFRAGGGTLSLGIIGTALGGLALAREGLGGLFGCGDGYGYGRGRGVAVEGAAVGAVAAEVCALKEIACKDAKIAELQAEKCASEKVAEATCKILELVERKTDKLWDAFGKLNEKECKLDKETAVLFTETRDNMRQFETQFKDYKECEAREDKFQWELANCRFVHAEKACPGPTHVPVVRGPVFEDLHVRCGGKDDCGCHGRDRRHGDSAVGDIFEITKIIRALQGAGYTVTPPPVATASPA